jgi:hypothetical protein
MTNQKPSSPAVISPEIEVVGIPSSEQVRYAVSIGAKLFIATPSSEVDIVNRVSSATRAEDIFGGSELTKVKDIMGTSIQVIEIESIRPSEFQNGSGLGAYIVIRAVDPDGQILSVAVGSVDGIIKLLKLRELNAFPRWVAFDYATRPTKSGNFPINLIDREKEMGGK